MNGNEITDRDGGGRLTPEDETKIGDERADLMGEEQLSAKMTTESVQPPSVVRNRNKWARLSSQGASSPSPAVMVNTVQANNIAQYKT